MDLAKTHHIHLQNGKFAGTSPDDLLQAFVQFAAAPPPQGWVVHFHGGLVSRASAVTTAELLLPKYEAAGAYPFFFVWESGPWETIRNNLRDISQEPFFQQLLIRLKQYLLPKLGVSPGAEESLASTVEAMGQPEFLAGEDVPFDELPVPPAGLSTTDISEAELERELANDPALKRAYHELQARVAAAQRGTMTEAVIEGIPEPGVLPSPASQSDLFGPQAQGNAANESLGIGWAARTALVAVRVGRRVISRFIKQRDHGWYTTIVEELLRELYVDSIGSTFFWKQMKKDTADAFGGDPLQQGGSAFLDQLQKLVPSGTTPPRVTLVGHSAGATFVSQFLLAAHRVLPKEFLFDVVLLAPAVDCELFSAAIDTNRIRNIRVFGMSDSLESQDALLRPLSANLRAVYPRSLLYFVSGLLETVVDLPLVGMQRFYDKSHYASDSFPALKKVRGFLLHAPDRQVWSVADNGAGRQCTATHHGAFDDEDAATLASVMHIVRQGFSSIPAGLEISRESLEASLSGLSADDLDLVVMALPQSCQERFPLRVGYGESSFESVGGSQDSPSESRTGSVHDLLETAQQLPGGFTQLLLSAHRAKPEAQLLQQHLKSSSRTPRVQKSDIVLQQAFQSSGIVEEFNPASESTVPSLSVQKTQPVLIRLRDAQASLEGLEGLEVVSRVGRIVAAKATQATVERLNDDERVISVELSSQNSHVDCAASMAFIGAIAPDTSVRLAEQGDQCLIGIIDAEIDVLHAAFREPDQFDAAGILIQRGLTRLVAVWDQRDPSGPAPPGLEGIGGTLHTEVEINAYIQAAQVGKNLMRLKDGHGTHVSSIAAGTPLPQSGFPGGVAPLAKLVVVITSLGQFEGGSPDSLGYSLNHNAALQFIEDTATQLSLPVVINLSQGMNSGAHDGSSSVETMFDDFCLNGRRPGRVIVKSAGNDRDGAGHAFVTLNSNSIEFLKWESQTPIPTALGSRRLLDVMELWFDSINELTFRLVSPSGEKSERVNWSNLNPPKISFTSGNTYALRYERFCKDNGASRLRVEIRNGSTMAIEAGPKGAPAPRDPWTLEITSGALVAPAEIDAWIDRTDPLLARYITHVSEDRTLSVPGTAHSVIAVGAIGSAFPLQVGKFSAYGTTRDGRKKPEVSAPGIGIRAAASNTNHDMRLDQGTSMAAPHVTGAIALVLSACQKTNTLPNAVQIVGVMRTMQAGLWDRGTGYGKLDTAALLRGFGGGGPPPPPPPALAALPAAPAPAPIPPPV